MRKTLLLALSLFALTLNQPMIFAITVGQLDTFEDGTTQGWTVGNPTFGSPSPAAPVNVSANGPGGIDDNFLMTTAFGYDGPGSRYSIFNLSQWAGDYSSAGVASIQMQVRNFGETDLQLRLALFDGGVTSAPNHLVISEDALLVPSGSGWLLLTFSLDPDALLAILGDTDSALSHVTQLRLFHNPDPTFLGPPSSIPAINASLGIDNIRANGPSTVAVPEVGSSMPLLGLGLTALLLLKKKATS